MVRPLLSTLFLILCAGLAACGGGRPAPALAFVPDSLPEARVGQAYREAIGVAANRTPVGGMSVSEGRLPPGLELRHESGQSTAEILGVPGEAGDFRFTVRASCLGTNEHGQVGQQEWVISVR